MSLLHRLTSRSVEDVVYCPEYFIFKCPLFHYHLKTIRRAAQDQARFLWFFFFFFFISILDGACFCNPDADAKKHAVAKNWLPRTLISLQTLIFLQTVKELSCVCGLKADLQSLLWHHIMVVFITYCIRSTGWYMGVIRTRLWSSHLRTRDPVLSLFLTVNNQVELW